MKKMVFRMVVLAALLLAGKSTVAAQPKEKIVVAYVCSWTNERLPDPTLMTHINYAFGHVKKTFDGVNIQNEPFLRKVVALRKQNPKLKIMLSVGGWTSGNFSEMAATAKTRTAFAKDCKRIVDEYGLDGIDIDWEYPTSNEAGISSSPDDTKNFTLLMRDLRKALGKKKLLTAATIADGLYIDFPACIKYMDFVNIMAYDVANPPKHHTTLFRSPLSGRITVEEAINAHIRNGVPAEKLTLGMPLYGRGDHSNKVLDQYIKSRNADGRYYERWDEVGQVPYLVDQSGQLVWGFDNPRSLAAKCQLIIDRGLLGGMYWECTEDNAQLDEMRTIHLSLMKNGKGTIPQKRVLILTDRRKEMTDALGELLADKARENDCEVCILSPKDIKGERPFDPYHVVISDATTLFQMTADGKKAFESFIDEARGSFISLADMAADGKKAWEWYGQFTDSLRIAPIGEGMITDGGQPLNVLWVNTAKRGVNYHFTPSATASNLKYAEQPLTTALCKALHEN